jgi:hypothetical protein
VTLSIVSEFPAAKIGVDGKRGGKSLFKRQQNS